MNYRHAFHAGNFADCMKHALLFWLLRAMQRKPAGVFVLDTHAGAGLYDLAATVPGPEGEWRQGIGRIGPASAPVLAEWRALALAGNRYRGSPALLAALLRQQDRLACCECVAEEAAALRRRLRGPAVAVHCRDGWQALAALLPPAGGLKRALVLIDPPYEDEADYARLAAGFARARQRMPAAVLAGWYPVKQRARVRALQAAIREHGVRDVVAAELWLREPLDPARLAGCGLLVANPPWGFDTAARENLTALRAALGNGETGEAALVQRLTDE
jgi:23S rRNA (adenine2030-N6)-methyltransferase